MSLPVSKAVAGDFLEVAALDRIAWPVRPETYIPDGEHVWRVWCEHATVLVARTDGSPLTESGTVAGALLMFPTDGRELFLHKIMVHPDCRGRGIGSALMRDALGRAKAPVLLTVDPENTPAVRLYQSFGFTVRERVDGYYRPHEHRAVMVYVAESPTIESTTK